MNSLKHRLFEICLSFTASLWLASAAWATEVSCPVEVYTDPQWDAYADFYWDCMYYIDYAYVDDYYDRPGWYHGHNTYWGEDWYGYPSGHWEPYVASACYWVVTDIYDVGLLHVLSPPYTQVAVTYHHEGGVTYTELQGGMNPGSMHISLVNNYYDSPNFLYGSATQQVSIDFGLDTVTGADFIGTSLDTQVYATNTSGGLIMIQLSDPPTPDTTITWTGGLPVPGNQLQRIVSRSLNQTGELVTASVCGNTIFKGKFYVFNGPPNSSAVTVTDNVTQDPVVWNFAPSDAFGATVFYLPPTNPIYQIYYSAGKWKFVFNSASYDTKWDIRSRGRTDVPNPTASPFPLGMGMDAASTEFQKKAQAKSDLTPNASGLVATAKYHSSAMVHQHEFFHMSDFRENYLKPRMLEAEASIENQEVSVTLSNLVPAVVLSGKESDFADIRSQKAATAFSDYTDGGGHEDRAYLDGKAGYNALSNAINP